MRSIGGVLFCLWLLAWGMIEVFSLNFSGMHVILGIVAIVAALLLLMGK